AFAWRLFEMWQEIGAPKNQDWALTALGHFGGDASVLKLVRLIRSWAEKKPTQPRAFEGLDCLRMIGTKAALMELNHLVHTAPTKEVQERAREVVQAVLRQRGFDSGELEDRAVPNLGLDERGGRELDFGPRHFRVLIGPGLRPVLRDSEGTFRDHLPRPATRGDPERALPAVETWRQSRQPAREVFRLQTARWERALLECRHWTVGEFEQRIARHPLLCHLARQLLWAGCSKDTRPAVPFR